MTDDLVSNRTRSYGPEEYLNRVTVLSLRRRHWSRIHELAHSVGQTSDEFLSEMVMEGLGQIDSGAPFMRDMLGWSEEIND